MNLEALLKSLLHYFCLVQMGKLEIGFQSSNDLQVSELDNNAVGKKEQ